MTDNNLNYNDYINILDYYNIRLPSNKNKLKDMAEKILARKLCGCIKKLEPHYKTGAIPICTKSVLNNKQKTRGKFNCKKNSIQLYRRKTMKNRKTQKMQNNQ